MKRVFAAAVAGLLAGSGLALGQAVPMPIGSRTPVTHLTLDVSGASGQAVQQAPMESDGETFPLPAPVNPDRTPSDFVRPPPKPVEPMHPSDPLTDRVLLPTLPAAVPGHIQPAPGMAQSAPSDGSELWEDLPPFLAE